MSEVSMDEIEDFFNSSNFDIEDEALKTLNNVKKSVSKVEKEKSEKKKIKPKKERRIVEPKVEKPKAKESKVEKPKVKKPEPEVEAVEAEESEVDDDELYDLMGMSKSSNFEVNKKAEDKEEPEAVEGFEGNVVADDEDFDDIEDFDIEGDVFFEEEDVVAEAAVEEKAVEVEAEPEAETEVEEVGEAEEAEVEEVKEVKEVEEDKSDKEAYDEEREAELDQLRKVCRYPEYLADPAYERFYKEKLRVVLFLRKNCPKINFEKVEKEIQDMYVPVNDKKVISLDQFNAKLEKIQAYKNRLTKIKSLMIKDYVLRKRVTKLLENYLMKQSGEKSQDKRNGEIMEHMFDLSSKLGLVEAAFQDVDQIGSNLESAYENLSRQITCMQERNREINRGEEPYVVPEEESYDTVVEEEKKPDKKMGYQDWDKIV